MSKVLMWMAAATVMTDETTPSVPVSNPHSQSERNKQGRKILDAIDVTTEMRYYYADVPKTPIEEKGKCLLN